MKIMDKHTEKWSPIQILDIGYYPQCYSISLEIKHVTCFALCHQVHPGGECFLPNRIFPVVLHDGEMTIVFDGVILDNDLSTKEISKLIRDFEELYKEKHKGK